MCSLCMFTIYDLSYSTFWLLGLDLGSYCFWSVPGLCIRFLLSMCRQMYGIFKTILDDYVCDIQYMSNVSMSNLTGALH